MTVAELIELLATYPPGLRVVEDGFDDVLPERVSVTRIELDVGRAWWEGRHAAAAAGGTADSDAPGSMRSRWRAPRVRQPQGDDDWSAALIDPSVLPIRSGRTRVQAGPHDAFRSCIARG